MSPARPIAILGAGNMGTALAKVCALNGSSVVLWDHFPDVVAEINQQRHNSRYLPGVSLSPNITAVTAAGEAVRAAQLIVLAVPSPFIQATLEQALPGSAADAVFLNVAKGIDAATREPVHVGVAQQLGGRPLVLLAGPAIANEFSRGLPAAVVLASDSISNADRVRLLFEGEIFRVTTSSDVTGAALGGILKNVYAILLGYVAAAAGESRNLEAAVLNASLREMAALSLALGAERETIFGLAGLGDLVATGFHDLVCNAGGTQNLTVEGVEALWCKVPDEVVAVPPPGGSKGYQVQVTEKVLGAMFGNDHDQLLRSKLETVKNRLRDAGGLLAAKS